MLFDLGFRTTKTVWPFKGDQEPVRGGTTCEDPEYLTWVQKLQQQGFEIALHNATYHTSNREQVIYGLEQFKKYFNSYPVTHINHVGCNENIYWGWGRVSGLNKLLYSIFLKFKNLRQYEGHIEGSELFWGDLCKKHIQYVENFSFPDINTLKACPYMPYFDKKRHYVNQWFAASEGGNCETFNETISEENQDRLEAEGGACIMYTHFGVRFYENGLLNPRFKKLMERLSSKAGWFVPVSTMLDHIRKQKGNHSLSFFERYQLEWRWFIGKLISGGSS
jgi:hypothetical protein